MTYRDFIHKANDIGVNRLCNFSIHNVRMEGKLQYENGKWFLCQDELNGDSCRDKLGYEFSYVINNTTEADHVEFLEPALPLPKPGFRYGVEIECYFPEKNYKLIRAAADNLQLQWGSDGSVRPPDSGTAMAVELRTAGGWSIEDLSAMLIKFEAIATKYSIKVNKSCGLHIHISNERFYRGKDIKRIISTWVSIEDVLFSTQPQSRLTNKFCKRKLRNIAIKDYPKLENKEKYEIMEELNEDRYQSLNFAALSYHGTIECRLHAGTTNATKIINWATLLTAIYNYAFNDYKKRELDKIFMMPIDNLKINRVWDILKISKDVRTFYNRRICKFTFSTLNSQLDLVKQVFKLRPAKTLLLKELNERQEAIEEAKKKLEELRHESSDTQRKIEVWEEHASNTLGAFGVVN